jgi:hypothetical protein
LSKISERNNPGSCLKGKRQMKRVLAILAATTFPVLAAVTVVSFAQQPQPVAQTNIVVNQQRVMSQDGMPPPPPGDFLFVGTEVNFSGKVVKGAPYSAQAVTETIQTLGDGNRIINKNTSSLYRDSEGRTRRELTIKLLGPLGDGGEALQTIFINDPVAGVSYSLDSKNHVAHKTMPFKLRTLKPGELPPGEPGHRFELKVAEPGQSGVVVRTPPGGAPEGAGVVVRAPMSGVTGVAEAGAKPESEFSFSIRTEGAAGSTYMFRRKGPNDQEVKEQLGKQNIEGVEAEGTRTTITIPAGEIGNERAIEIVSERWYSAELQMDVMTRHNDPRSGETIYRLTNINRSEPAKSLFEVPADYTIKEGMKAPMITTLPTRIRKPEQE